MAANGRKPRGPQKRVLTPGRAKNAPVSIEIPAEDTPAEPIKARSGVPVSDRKPMITIGTTRMVSPRR